MKQKFYQLPFAAFIVAATSFSCSDQEVETSVDDRQDTARYISLEDKSALRDSIAALEKKVTDFQLYQTSPDNADDAFEKLEAVFKNPPAPTTLRKLVESVMSRHRIVINNENVLRVGNALYALRTSSTKGVTEMDILWDIYLKGTAELDFVTQAGISAANLELKK